VGVNAFELPGEPPIEALRIDPAAEREQVERLRALRGRRTGERAAAALGGLTAAAREDRNVMPAVLECVRAEATLGEISNALREVYGEFREAGLE
jgi:methylmalonyl-CoA mutase N-terminal domain/subunit